MARSDVSNHWPDDWPQHWQDLLAGSVLDDLSDAERAELAQLLAAHPDLQSAQAAYAETWAQLPLALPPQTPPDRLEHAILGQLHPPQTTSLAIAAPKRATHKWLWLLMMAGAIVASLLLGWENGRLRQALRDRQQALENANATLEQLQQEQRQNEAVLTTLSRSDARIYALQGRGNLADASGHLVVLADQAEAVLFARNVPPLPADHVYRLWGLLPSTQDLIYCGQFQSRRGQPSRWHLPRDICQEALQQVIITLDPAQASTATGGDVVMISPSAPE